MSTTKNALQTAQRREAASSETAPRKYVFTPHGASFEEDSHLYDKAVFSWEAPQYIQHAKTKRWYFIAAAISGLFIVGALVMKDWTFALAILALSGVYYYTQEYHPPRIIRIVISEMGIKVGDTVHPFSHIQAFWMMYHPPHLTTLNLRLHRKFAHDVVIQLADQDPVAIRRFLCGEIAEWEGKTEHLTDLILRLLKL